MSCSCAPAAKAAPAAASEFCTFIFALPPKVAGSRWVHASCMARRPCRITIISPRSLRSSSTARPPRRQWSSTMSATSLPASAIVNQTTSPEQRRRIPRTSGSSALSTANPSRGTASTTTCLTSASCSRVSMPRIPRWSARTLSTTATSLRW